VASRDREHQEASRLRQEMLLARTLQDIMLPPQPPRIRHWAVGLRLEPALEVGGDLYILERLSSGDWVVCLGDISGKSVYGLIYLSMIVAHTRAAVREGLSPEEVARQVNAQVYDMLAPETYAALFIGLLNPETGLLTFVNCGHPPPLVVSPKQGEVRLLPMGGIVIGATREVDYRQACVAIAPGEALVAYTDGLSEARNRQGVEFGEEHIGRIALAGLQEGRNAEELVGRLLLAARRWSATPGRDDATCLVLHRLPEEPYE
jgi:sigma-B regulation protein RsbU (phosphoserine phosphatase)